MIKASHVFKYYDQNMVLDDVSIDLKKCQSLGIVGESGSGKSTFANILLGFESLDKGEILYNGKSLMEFNKNEWKSYRKQVQVVFQDAQNSLDPRMKIKDIISEPLKNFTNFDKIPRYKEVERVLKLVDLNESDMEKYPYAFSTGQQKRINIARAIVCHPKIVVMDEATSGLDPEVKNNLVKLIQKLQIEEDITFVIITHDIKVAQDLSSQIVILKKGKIIESKYANNGSFLFESDYAHELIEAVPKFKYQILGGLCLR